MPKYFLTGFCVFILAFILACSEEKQGRPSSYEQANEAIEDHNFQSAISLMNDELAKNPNNPKARVILASAHAARAGIYFQSYINFAQEMVDSAKSNSAERSATVFARLRDGASSPEQMDLIDALASFNKAFWRLSDVIIKFEAIPLIITPEQYADVSIAVQVLSVGENLDHGAMIYRGLLRLVLLRYHIRENYRFGEVKDCYMDLTGLYKKVEQFHLEVQLIFQDFVYGTSQNKKSAEIQAFAVQMNTAFNDVLNRLEKVSATATELGLFLLPFGVECPVK